MPCRRLERYCPRFWLPALGRPVQPCRLAGAQTPSGRRCFWPLTARSGVTRAAPPPRCWSGRTPLAASACRWAPEPAFPANNWEGMHQVVAIQRLLSVPVSCKPGSPSLRLCNRAGMQLVGGCNGCVLGSGCSTMQLASNQGFARVAEWPSTLCLEAQCWACRRPAASWRALDRANASSCCRRPT